MKLNEDRRAAPVHGGADLNGKTFVITGTLSRYGRDVQFGGLILTAGKALGAVVPGFSLGTPSLPAAFQRFGMPGAAPAAAMAGRAAPVALPALPPGGQANYPRPATVDSDVGL